MKTTLRTSLILFAAISLFSCRKVIDRPYQPEIAPLSGTWIVSATDINDGYGWQSYSSGFENSLFNFYNNGAAQLNDNHSSFEGNWYVSNIGNGYYDEYGDFYTGSHQAFEIRMSDSYSGNALDLYFDYISFVNPNLFIATSYDGKNVERFSFSRY